MKTNTLFLASWLRATKCCVSCHEQSARKLIIGGEKSNMTWTGTIAGNDTVVSFTGSDLRDIELQISKTKPGFSWPDMQDSSTRILDDPINTTIKEILCYVRWHFDYASVFHIKQGIEYLRKIGGYCHVGPGPANCTRVSCSYASGIWFCNDSHLDAYVECSIFGDYAEKIIDKCY
ncbi:hypothetical protein GGR57DRAFT_486571 [Xylariaceae sp. FL1272]|nr:hypothetical protein GGR57DRAFT_486571 [Xylariaceae sp. FL1272]